MKLQEHRNTKPGIVFIESAPSITNPTMNYLVDNHEISLDCAISAAKNAGHRTIRAPITDINALSSPEYPILYLTKGHLAKQLENVSDETRNAIFSKKLISIVGNPPFQPGTRSGIKGDFSRKIAFISDENAIKYSRGWFDLDTEIVRLFPQFYDINLGDEAFWRPTAERLYPLLFVGNWEEPDHIRERLLASVSGNPSGMRFIKLLIDVALSFVDAPIYDVISEVCKLTSFPFNWNNPVEMSLMYLVNRLQYMASRERLYSILTQLPSLIISSGIPRSAHVSDRCQIQRPKPFREILELMKETRCLVSNNPNGMSGAVSERISNAMRRGVVVINTPNISLNKYDSQSLRIIDPKKKNTSELLSDLISTRSSLNQMGEEAIQVAKSDFDPRKVLPRMLDIVTMPA